MNGFERILNSEPAQTQSDTPLASRNPLSESNISYLNRQSTPKDTHPIQYKEQWLNRAPTMQIMTNSEMDRIFKEGNEVYEANEMFPPFSDHSQETSSEYHQTDSQETEIENSALDQYAHIRDESNVVGLEERFQNKLPNSSPNLGNDVTNDSSVDFLSSPSVQVNQSRIERNSHKPAPRFGFKDFKGFEVINDGGHLGDDRHHFDNQYSQHSQQQYQNLQEPKKDSIGKGFLRAATETTRKMFPDMRRNVVQKEAEKAEKLESKEHMAMVPSPQKPHPREQNYYINPNFHRKVDMSFLGRPKNRRPTSVEFSPIKQYHEIPGRRRRAYEQSSNMFQPRGSYYSPQFDASYDQSFEQRYERYNGDRGSRDNRDNEFSDDEWEDYADYPNHTVNTPCVTPRAKKTRNQKHSSHDHNYPANSRDQSNDYRFQAREQTPTPEADSDAPASPLNLPILLSIWLQLAYNAIIMAVISYFVYTFYSTVKRDVDMKVDEYSADILQEMAMCSKDYIANNCMPGKRVPALETMCNAWERCMNRDPKVVGRARVSAETFAEIINGFLRPISFKSMVFVLFMLVGSLFVCNFGFGTYRGPLYQQVREKEKDKDEKKSDEDRGEKEKRSREKRSRGYDSRYSGSDSPSFYASPRYYRHRYGRRRY